MSHDEFKLCLRALGYDLPLDDQRAVDIEFERILDIVDPQRLGYIGLQDYMSFLIRKETENISSMDDVVDAFKALTENGDKPYITRKELVTVKPIHVFNLKYTNSLIQFQLNYNRICHLIKPNIVCVKWHPTEITRDEKFQTLMIMKISLELFSREGYKIKYPDFK